MMSSDYLVLFAQAHNDFRIPELRSVAELYGFEFSITPSEYNDNGDPLRPFMVLRLESEEHARLLTRRCILIKSIYELYGQGATYEQLHQSNRANEALWSRFVANTSFRFNVTAYNHKIPAWHQRDIVESFAYMDFLGKIDMKKPEIVLGCFEEYPECKLVRGKHEVNEDFIQVYFGRLIETGTARPLITKFDVKKRMYYGNTSMESEISLLMANQTLASPGKFIYDPFMGTGSMAYPTSHFGAFVFGSDIDGRQMRGKGRVPGVLRAAEQYGTAARIIDLCTFDVTNNPLRCGELFDAIITDPPYGVRAGAKRLGRKKSLPAHKQEACLEHAKRPRGTDEPYIPPTKPYELSQLVVDLVLLARYLLRPNGRLVFFLPTVTEEYEELDINDFLCDGMELVANSLQDFGSWGRRLVTIKKFKNARFSPPLFDSKRTSNAHTPAHKDFREKYFQGFKKDDISVT